MVEGRNGFSQNNNGFLARTSRSTLQSDNIVRGIDRKSGPIARCMRAVDGAVSLQDIGALVSVLAPMQTAAPFTARTALREFRAVSRQSAWWNTRIVVCKLQLVEMREAVTTCSTVPQNIVNPLMPTMFPF